MCSLLASARALAADAAEPSSNDDDNDSIIPETTPLIPPIPAAAPTRNQILRSTGFLFLAFSFHGIGTVAVTAIQSSLHSVQNLGLVSMCIGVIACLLGMMLTGAVLKAAADQKMIWKVAVNRKRIMFVCAILNIAGPASNFYPTFPVMIPGSIIAGFSAGVLQVASIIYTSDLADFYSNLPDLKSRSGQRGNSGQGDQSDGGDHSNPTDQSDGGEHPGPADAGDAGKPDSSHGSNEGEIQADVHNSGRGSSLEKRPLASGETQRTLYGSTDARATGDEESSGQEENLGQGEDPGQEEDPGQKELVERKRATMRTRFFAANFVLCRLGAMVSYLACSKLITPLQPPNGTHTNVTQLNCGPDYCNAELPWDIHQAGDEERAQIYNFLGMCVGACGMVAVCLAAMHDVGLPEDRRMPVDADGDAFHWRLWKIFCFAFQNSKMRFLLPIFLSLSCDEAFWVAGFSRGFISCLVGMPAIGEVMVVAGGVAAAAAIFSFSSRPWIRVSSIFTSRLLHIIVAFFLIFFHPKEHFLLYLKIATALWSIGTGIMYALYSALVSCIFKDDLEIAFSSLNFWSTSFVFIIFLADSYICMKPKLCFLIALAILGTGLYCILEYRTWRARRNPPVNNGAREEPVQILPPGQLSDTPSPSPPPSSPSPPPSSPSTPPETRHPSPPTRN